MNDISSKQITLRTAIAVGMVICSESSLQLIKENKIPKGSVIDIARASGLISAKHTQHLIPHCHPVTIDGMDIQFEFITPGTSLGFEEKESKHFGILVKVEAKSIGRTGIEMEALTASSMTCLTLYDMMKYLNDPLLEVTSVKLLKKTGGKSDRKRFTKRQHTSAILVCSDSTAKGERKDKSGIIIKEILEKNNAIVKDYVIVPDEKESVQNQINKWVSEGIQFIFTTGGTGLSPRDITVEAVQEMIEKEANGITEAMRVYGGMRTPLAMMSRAVAGGIKDTLVVTLPGSSNGARESLEAIVPAIFHANNMLKGGGHG